MPSKVAFDPKEPCLGRIRVDSVAPPHSPTSIKRCISRVEETPEIAHADLFADISCDAPLKESYISNLRTDGPGLRPDEPMAIVQTPTGIVRVESSSIPDGKYIIKNRVADIYWTAFGKPVHFWRITLANAKHSGNMAQVNEHFPIISCSVNNSLSKWDITHDINGNIFITSTYAPSSWVGADVTGSTVPVPWRLIPADGKFY